MATRQLTCFIAVCDDCETEYEHDYTPHWPSAGEATDDAVDGGEWWSKGEALLCRDCKHNPHAFVASELYADECDRCPNPAEEHEPEPAGGDD